MAPSVCISSLKPKAAYSPMFDGQGKSKIACGNAHFQAIETGEDPGKYVVASSLDDVLAHS